MPSYQQCAASLESEHVRRDPSRNQVVLSPRQFQVAAMVAQGLSNKDIAARLNISPRTVQHTLSAVFHRVRVGSRYEVIVAVLNDRVTKRALP